MAAENDGQGGSYEAAKRDTPLRVEDDVVSAATSRDGTAEVGQSFNAGPVRTGGSMTWAIIGLVLVLALILLFVLLFALR